MITCLLLFKKIIAIFLMMHATLLTIHYFFFAFCLKVIFQLFWLNFCIFYYFLNLFLLVNIFCIVLLQLA